MFPYQSEGIETIFTSYIRPFVGNGGRCGGYKWTIWRSIDW